MTALATPTRTNRSPANSLGRQLIEYARPRQLLSLREFAEANIYVEHGSKVSPFRVSTQPLAGVLFDELDSDWWWTAFITGPSQSSKTTCAHLIPAAHTLFERRESIVLGIPLDEMVDDKIRGDLFRMMRRSPKLKHYLPETHREDGRGGRIVEKVTFTNGVEAKPMTVGSGDQAVAGYPARWALVTEAAGWSRGKVTSQESDRLNQVAARLRSHKRSRRRLWVEGTTTIEEDLPWRARGADNDERVISSRSLLLWPCPHCGDAIAPCREHLRGWQEAESELEAAERAYYACPSCGAAINDDQRRRAMRHVFVLHYGQTFDRERGVIGPRPETHTLFFRWQACHNLLLDIGDVAVDEWEASQIPEGTQERENAERKLCQFVHCLPFRSTLVDTETLDARTVRKRTDSWPRNVLPPDTDKVTIGVDLGDWTGWWIAIAWRATGVRHVFAYGAFDVKRNEHDDARERLGHALSAFDAEIVGPGFVQEGATNRTPASLVWIDGNYQTAAVAEWVRGKGSPRTSQYRFARGAGRSTRGAFGGPGRTYESPKARTKKRPRQGREWYGEINFARGIQENTFNADYWKLNVHEGLAAVAGSPGSIALFAATSPNEHAKLSQHLCNEQLRREWKPGVGDEQKWVRTGAQHWLDALAMASAAGDEAGFSPQVAATEAAEERPKLDWSSL